VQTDLLQTQRPTGSPYRHRPQVTGVLCADKLHDRTESRAAVRCAELDQPAKRPVQQRVAVRLHRVIREPCEYPVSTWLSPRHSPRCSTNLGVPVSTLCVPDAVHYGSRRPRPLCAAPAPATAAVRTCVQRTTVVQRRARYIRQDAGRGGPEHDGLAVTRVIYTLYVMCPAHDVGGAEHDERARQRGRREQRLIARRAVPAGTRGRDGVAACTCACAVATR
jgi:hypothetical protein